PFKATLIYGRSAPIDALLADMAALRAFDGRNERRNRLWIVAGIAGVIGVLVGFFGGASILGPLDEYGGAVIVASATLAVVGFTMGVIRWKYNLEDRRYEL